MIYSFHMTTVFSIEYIIMIMVAITVPMALRIAFLIMAARSSMNSIELDHGSRHVVITYFTPSLFFVSSFIG